MFQPESLLDGIQEDEYRATGESAEHIACGKELQELMNKFKGIKDGQTPQFQIGDTQEALQEENTAQLDTPQPIFGRLEVIQKKS